MKMKAGFFNTRVKLPLWIFLMAFWTIFFPSQGVMMLEGYIIVSKERLKKMQKGGGEK